MYDIMGLGWLLREILNTFLRSTLVELASIPSRLDLPKMFFGQKKGAGWTLERFLSLQACKHFPHFLPYQHTCSCRHGRVARAVLVPPTSPLQSNRHSLGEAAGHEFCLFLCEHKSARFNGTVSQDLSGQILYLKKELENL